MHIQGGPKMTEGLRYVIIMPLIRMGSNTYVFANTQKLVFYLYLKTLKLVYLYLSIVFHVFTQIQSNMI